MSRLDYWPISIELFERAQNRKVVQHQESKKVLQQIHKRNTSKCLGQHHYMYLSKRSR